MIAAGGRWLMHVLWYFLTVCYANIRISTNTFFVWPCGKSGTQSFANVISRAKPVEAKMNESGKRGKKPNRVLLSTAGGRRY